MTQIKAIVGLIGQNCGISGSVLMVNESDLKATLTKLEDDNGSQMGTLQNRLQAQGGCIS